MQDNLNLIQWTKWPFFRKEISPSNSVLPILHRLPNFLLILFWQTLSLPLVFLELCFWFLIRQFSKTLCRKKRSWFPLIPDNVEIRSTKFKAHCKWSEIWAHLMIFKNVCVCMYVCVFQLLHYFKKYWCKQLVCWIQTTFWM